jgi:hypothetical protein
VVELVLVEVEAAHHGVDRAGVRVHGHEGALDLGLLGEVQLPLLSCRTRTIAPRRIWIFGSALSDRPDWAGFRPSPVMVTVSPDCSAATTLRGLASSTTAAFNSSLSGWSARASATRASRSCGSAGRST